MEAASQLVQTELMWMRQYLWDLKSRNHERARTSSGKEGDSQLSNGCKTEEWQKHHETIKYIQPLPTFASCFKSSIAKRIIL
eukprot:3250705-Amphidinium_carterae.1